MNIAIIPARGGSKRIPKKNTRPFLGKPIIGYSIEVALDCGLFDRVIVSTDDQEIAKTSREFGAEVPFTTIGLFGRQLPGRLLNNMLTKFQTRWMLCFLLVC